MKQKKRKWFTGLLTSACIVLLTVFLSSCGIEDYPYIDGIPESNINQEFNNRAVIRVPNTYSGTSFTNFAIYYRIYVSNIPQQSISPNMYSSINPTLASDYGAFSIYIDSTSFVNVNMDNLFQGRGYKYLNLEEDNILNILSSSVFGSSLVFDFSSSRSPTMTIGSNVYTLWRSDGNGLFNPQPDRLFRNKEALSRAENINSNTNADVANMNGITADDKHYTYAAMFIVAVGINAATYSNIYSTPSLIHVFQLPD